MCSCLVPVWHARSVFSICVVHVRRHCVCACVVVCEVYAFCCSGLRAVTVSPRGVTGVCVVHCEFV